MPIICNKEAVTVTALGTSVVQRLIAFFDTQGTTGPVAPPLVNHTQPTYVVDADYKFNP